MKILFLSPSGQLGGAELSLLDLLASLQAAEPEWRLGLIASEDGPLLARANGMGIETHLVPFPPSIARLGDASAANGRFSMIAKLASSTLPAWSYKRRLAGVIRSFAPDVLHTNGFKMHVLGALARGDSAVLWHVRDFVSERPVMARLLRHVARRSTLALANSKAVAEDLRGILNGSVRVQTVYNAIDLDQFSPVGPTLDLDALSGLPRAASDVVRIGLIATLAFWKGHEIFLQAMALLCKELVPGEMTRKEMTSRELPSQSKELPAQKLDIRGYVIGGGIYQTAASQNSLDTLRNLAAELGVSDRVGFTGHVADSAAAMRSLDIVVHASTRPEPFGRVIVEAMACGRAVIASAQGGAAEIVTPEVNAVTHISGDARSLADAMARLVADRDLRQRLGKAGFEHARSHFGRVRLAAELAPVYRKLAGSN